jgi:hypothetical protein
MTDYPVLDEGKGMHSPPSHSSWLTWNAAEVRAALEEAARREPDKVAQYVDTVPPWEKEPWLASHFAAVPWHKWWWMPWAGVPEPLWRDGIKPEDANVYRLSYSPLIVAVVLRSVFAWTLTENTGWITHSARFYRLRWRLFWRKIDPETDPRLRKILQGAMSLDALAGRDP